MSADHKRPLVAFVVVSILCALMLGHGIRSDAMVGIFGHSLSAAQNEATVTVRDSAPAVAPSSTATRLPGMSAERVVTAAPAAPSPISPTSPTSATKPTATAIAVVQQAAPATVVPSPVATPTPTTTVTPMPTTTVTPTPTTTPTATVPDAEHEGGQPAVVSARKAAREAAKEARRALKAADKAAAVAAKESDKVAKEAAKALTAAAKEAAKAAKLAPAPTSLPPVVSTP